MPPEVSTHLGAEAPLLAGRPEAERQQWARWVLGSHSDQFIPEMAAAVAELDRDDPLHVGVPVANPGPWPDDVVVVACRRGRHCLVVDHHLPCRMVLFDWSGEGLELGTNPHGWEVLSVATECKGQLMEEAWRRLALPPHGHYIGFVDDDVLLSTSAIARLLAVARIHGLPAAQPAVSYSSSLSAEYGWLRQRPGLHLHRVPIVEIMAPFLRRDLLDRAMPFAVGIRSGYGLDRFALPLAAADLGIWRFGAVDLTPMSHVRGVGSLDTRFSNGLLSKEEELLVRMRLMQAMGFPVDEPLWRRLEGAVAA
ncbi:hypothetical protein [Cyanobium sp. CH-040]|uniref:hypothetical protein n=1 Tax=Cyanobium sp. CH-040 TaxID=2823708 RepID=UPI0020CC2992|nr:hypothetical protein [Cyanobium sp. CH-040]